MGTKTFPLQMAKVTQMLLVLFMSQHLIQCSLSTSLAPVVLQWKDVQSKWCDMLLFLFQDFFLPSFNLSCLCFSYIVVDNTRTFDCTLCHFHIGFKSLLKNTKFFSQ